ncbi:hypothetical protein CC80DRAFT_318872 [Byssothecium circinans]|uniref:Uncharacterized protein n=1 Tax=Byssothecium circinans TaxID=147558 RepID=A0A6A5U1L7_9PLEO|nr:hypothetical protein CC80DRAFT_318872 [Byssothecium circinans]
MFLVARKSVVVAVLDDSVVTSITERLPQPQTPQLTSLSSAPDSSLTPYSLYPLVNIMATEATEPVHSRIGPRGTKPDNPTSKVYSQQYIDHAAGEFASMGRDLTFPSRFPTFTDLRRALSTKRNGFWYGLCYYPSGLNVPWSKMEKDTLNCVANNMLQLQPNLVSGPPTVVGGGLCVSPSTSFSAPRSATSLRPTTRNTGSVWSSS